MINKSKQKRIAVAMSGGVDSSVAAKLLVDQGHQVAGIFLNFWKPSYASTVASSFAKASEDKKAMVDKSAGEGSVNFENKCCSSEALKDARRVAEKIGIPLYVLDFSRIFKKQVVTDFLNEYGRGRTPNPCVRCNKSVKLGYLIKQAGRLGFDYVASGHYVKKFSIFPPKADQPGAGNFPPSGDKQFSNNKEKEFYKLYKAKDKTKDQSYFLYTLNQNELSHLLFPLAPYTKARVRQMAGKFKLPVAAKPDSQEICFIPEKNHNEFLRRHLKMRPGPIKLLDFIPPTPRLRRASKGAVTIGTHQGLPLYTVGQRKGIAIGGHGPYYVAKMDYKKNILYVVNDSRDEHIFKDQLIAKNVNWISGAAPAVLKCQAVIRYRHKPAECRLKRINPHTKYGKGINRTAYAVKFKKPQRAIAPGQSVVFYMGGQVLGGGIIK